jgi:hypothetical protein
MRIVVLLGVIAPLRPCAGNNGDASNPLQVWVNRKGWHPTH